MSSDDGIPSAVAARVDFEPSLYRYGRAGAHYLLSRPYWVSRHVETLELLSVRQAVRQLTIDLVLPVDRRTWVAATDDEVVYCIPVARVTKDRPPEFVDLRAEDGTTLPLLTRLSGEPTELNPDPGARPRPASGRAVDDAEQRSGRQ